MEKIEKARTLLEEKVNSVHFEDDMYTLVFDKVSELINEVGDELGSIDDTDDDVCWYDDVRDDMMMLLFDRIREWINK